MLQLINEIDLLDEMHDAYMGAWLRAGTAEEREELYQRSQKDAMVITLLRQLADSGDLNE